MLGKAEAQVIDAMTANGGLDNNYDDAIDLCASSDSLEDKENDVRSNQVKLKAIKQERPPFTVKKEEQSNAGSPTSITKHNFLIQQLIINIQEANHGCQD